MTIVQVFTLGRLAIQINEVPVIGFVSQKSALLFAYLLFHPREHPRDILAQTFWAETTNEQALKNLRTVLSNLQKLLGEYLIVTRETVQITRLEVIDSDLQTFDQLLNQLDQYRSRPYSPRKQREVLETVNCLYQGEFLAGVKVDNAPYLEQWILLERERVQNRFLSGMFHLTELCALQKDYVTAIEYGQRLLAMDAYWEDAYRLQLRVLAQSGNRTGALQLYDTLVSLLRDELDIEPEPETTRLYKEIAAGRLRVDQRQQQPPFPAPPRYLPIPSLIEDIQKRLDDPECRLLTLLGIGGIGKTSLARYIAHLRQEDYLDGIRFISLESLTGAEFVPQVVRNALNMGVVDELQSSQHALIEHLRSKHMLLILDNFEHVTTAAHWVAQLLDECPYLQIIVTSREQLNLRYEHIIHMRGLSYRQGVGLTPAAEVFAMAARQINPSFILDDHLEAVTRVCQLVDGLPLGILIAAGWVQFLTSEQIVEKIETNLDFLTMSRRDLPDRHQGIMALLTPVWDTLQQQERDVLTALSIFPGQFDLEAAIQVTGSNLTNLTLLSSKSLLSGDGLGRYQLHELLRRFTYQKAAETEQLEVLRRAHHHYYSQWLDDLFRANLPSHKLFAAIDVEYHNLWYFDWLPVDEQYLHILHLAKVLPDYWIARDIHLKEGIELLRQALPEAHGWLKANAYVRFGRLLAQVGEFKEAQPVLEEGLSLSYEHDDIFLETLALNELKRVYSELGDQTRAKEQLLKMIERYESTAVKDNNALREIFARAYSNLGVVYLQLGQLDESEKYALEGLKHHRDTANRIGEGLSFNILGIIALDRGNFDLARERFESALTIAMTIGHKRHQTIFSGNLAESLHKLGNFTEAYQKYCDTFIEAYQINNRKTMLNVLEQLSNVSIDLHQTPQATRFLGAALSLREALGIAVQPRQQAEFLEREHHLIDMLGQRQFEAEIQIGKTITLPEMVNLLTKTVLFKPP